MNVFYFNYSHDLALANGRKNYVPPLHVRQMETDLMPLAAMVAAQGDVVVVDERRMEVVPSFYKRSCPQVSFVSFANLPGGSSLQPWGWNANVVWKLGRHGYDSMLPAEFLSNVRFLSSRRWAVDVLRDLRDEMGDLPLCGEPQFCDTEEAAAAAIKNLPSSIVKAPLSGSGRGLRFGQGVWQPPLSGWCQRVIREQGGVVVEPLYCRARDFAAEFVASSDGEVHYVGLSLFHTTDRCSYLGNVVAHQEALMEETFRDFNAEVYMEVASWLERKLTQWFSGRYVGPLGIDMMLCCQDGKLLLHPCVEINLRCTMGHVALALSSRIAVGKKALFSLRYEKATQDLYNYCAQSSRAEFDASGRLTSGLMQLTPLHPEAHYVTLLETIIE